MRTCSARAVAVAAVLLLAPALPADAQIFGGGGDQVARKQVAEQTRRIDALQQQNDALAARLAALEGTLKGLDESIKGLSSFNPALDLAQRLELLREELTQLRGQMEVLGNEIQQTGRRQRDMYVDLDTRLRRLDPPGEGALVAPAEGTDVAAPASGKPTEEESRAYEAAQQQRRVGNYQGAIAAFRGFIAQYPRSTLAHRAQYWIGDSYYNLRDFKSSIAAQLTLIATYPESASVPDALLNIASSQLELGEKARARETMTGIVTRYPASDAAEKAKRRLAALK
jgi:tol-pal system protein YbgF